MVFSTQNVCGIRFIVEEFLLGGLEYSIAKSHIGYNRYSSDSSDRQQRNIMIISSNQSSFLLSHFPNCHIHREVYLRNSSQSPHHHDGC